ncbi:MAG: AAA family ATPase [Nitrospira sp.]|nr:AAA family ATPase [bacterium]MBL7050434.1 AAA family ATPase [Nitrospira sp.]
MSPQHREALAHLVYGFNSGGGFVLLTGEVGTGKTTICRCLLEQIPEDTFTAFILNPKLSVEELLASICDEFGIQYPAGNTSTKIFVDLINAYLLDAHERRKKAVIIIDEAQNLTTDVLEQLRLLTNLETSKTKLLQIILIGQPELRDKLSMPELRQLSQRITARYHLESLSKEDVSAYIAHRLSVAGLSSPVFTPASINALYALSHGIPRIINLICDRAMLGTFALDKKNIDKAIIFKASHEVLGTAKSPAGFKSLWITICIICLILASVVAASYYNTIKDAIVPVNITTDNNPDINEPSLIPRDLPATLNDSDQPESVMYGTSFSLSMTDLARLWGINISAHDKKSACREIEFSGLKCLSSSGSINVLRQFNRPVILQISEGEDPLYVTLKSMGSGIATIVIEGKEHTLPIERLIESWQGEYLILWKTPPGYKGDLVPGTSNALLPWIEKKISAISGVPVSYDNDSEYFYSDSRAARVIAFQKRQKLHADGIIGRQTLIRINTLTDSSVPLLVIIEGES